MGWRNNKTIVTLLTTESQLPPLVKLNNVFLSLPNNDKQGLISALLELWFDEAFLVEAIAIFGNEHAFHIGKPLMIEHLERGFVVSTKDKPVSLFSITGTSTFIFKETLKKFVSEV